MIILHIMDCPKDDEFLKKNLEVYAQELEVEEEYKDLMENGSKCDDCQETFHIAELFTHEGEEGETLLLCDICRIT